MPPTTLTRRDDRGRPSPIIQGWDPNTGRWPTDPQTRHPAARVINAVRIGAFINAAATYAGLSRSTVFGWLARGRAALPDTDTWTREDIPPTERVYVDFLIAVHTADGSLEVELTGLVLQGARSDPGMALKMLGRKWPHWREGVVLSHGLEDPDAADDPLDGVLDDPRVAASLVELSHRLQDAESSAGVVEGVVVAEDGVPVVGLPDGADGPPLGDGELVDLDGDDLDDDEFDGDGDDVFDDDGDELDDGAGSG